MITAPVTSKGQITIPKSIRDFLHLSVGNKISFVLNGKKQVIMKPVNLTVDELFGKFRNPKKQPISIEKMNSHIKKRMKRKV